MIDKELVVITGAGSGKLLEAPSRLGDICFYLKTATNTATDTGVFISIASSTQSARSVKMYESKTTSNGQGLFAKQGIAAGTLILSERRLLSLEVDIKTANEASQEARDTLVNDALDLEDNKFTMLQMHCMRAFNALKASQLTKHGLRTDAAVKDLLVATLLKQGVPIVFAYPSIGTKRGTRKLYDDIPKLRRSCNPNAHVSMTKGERRMEVRAMKDIKAGEEIVYCQESPFMRKEERITVLDAKDCKCGVCSGVQGKGKPDENLYRGLQRKFDLVYSFRKQIFDPGQMVDLSTFQHDQEMYDKAKAINATARAEINEVQATCNRLKEQKKRCNLMHSCFADIYDVIHIINLAYVVEHGEWKKRVADIETSKQSNIDAGEHAGRDAQDTTTSQAEDSQYRMEILGSGGLNLGPIHHTQVADQRTGQEGNGRDDKMERGGDEEGRKDQETPPDSSAQSSEPSNAQAITVQEALASAFTAKLHQIIVTVTCYGYKHWHSQQVLKHAWNLSRQFEDFREALQKLARELGFFLREKEDGSFQILELLDEGKKGIAVIEVMEGVAGLKTEERGESE